MNKKGQSQLQSKIKTQGNKKSQINLQKQNKNINKKYQQVLQAGRQIFSISINLLQIIHNIKQGNSKYDSLSDDLQTHKISLGKSHKTLISQGKIQGSQLVSQSVVRQHKSKLQNYVQSGNVQGVVQVLLSLRVNALQIAPQLRKNLVQQLIRRDIFKITSQENFKFLNQILSIKSKSLKHAITSLISVLVSTIKGIQYITYNNNDVIIQKVIKNLQQQQNGSVTQRFCLAILQKCSIKQNLMASYIDNDLINWVLRLVKMSFTIKIHIFCLDFATAMLANIIHSKWCQVVLANKSQQVIFIMDSILKFIFQQMQVSVLMHLLIALSYLCKPKFKRQIQQVSLKKRLNQFMIHYQSYMNPDSQAQQMDKKTVLDLCTHIFHNKQQEYQNQQKLRQYQNSQGQLIFQCFQDQVS